MNILPINSQQQLYSFKGLWGHSYSQISSHDRGVCIVKSYEYHPFSNESSESVQNMVNSKTKYIWYNLYDKTKLRKSNVYVREKLPFTQEEFDLYKQMKSKTKKRTRIRVEKGLADADLGQFLNNRFRYSICNYFHPVKKTISKIFRMKK